MHENLMEIFQLPDISEYQNVDLQMLSEQCAVLEEKLCLIARGLPEKQRQIIEEYVSTRNDLEVESFKTALRLGKRYYR